MGRLRRIARAIYFRIAASERKQQFIAEKYSLPLETITQLDKIDPSKGKYLEWMARRVKERNIIWPEDSPRVKKALQDFKTITNKKNLREQYEVSPDINKYTLHDLEDVSDSYHGVSGPKPESLQMPDDPDLKKVYDDGEYAVVSPQTPEAICKISSGSKWCTSDMEVAKLYSEYGDEILVIYKDGKKYAQTDQVEQLMDLRDRTLKDDKLVSILLVNNMLSPEYGFNYIKDEMGNKRLPAMEEALLKGRINSDWVVKYANEVVGGRWTEAEPVIMKDPSAASYYARSVLKERWPEAEPTIAKLAWAAKAYSDAFFGGQWGEATESAAKDPGAAYRHARDAIKGRWPEAESVIMSEANAAAGYAKDVLKQRWPEAEPVIVKDPRAALGYARDVIGGRWPEAEPYIMEKPSSAAQYAVEVIKDRWPEGEPSILGDSFALGWYSQMFGGEHKDSLLEAAITRTKDARSAYNYAKNVLGERWLPAEQIIMGRHPIPDSHVAADYAADVIKGRWPAAEKVISENTFSANAYIKGVLKQRWPAAERYIREREDIEQVVKERMMNQLYKDTGFSAYV